MTIAILNGQNARRIATVRAAVRRRRLRRVPVDRRHPFPPYRQSIRDRATGIAIGIRTDDKIAAAVTTTCDVDGTSPTTTTIGNRVATTTRIIITIIITMEAAAEEEAAPAAAEKDREVSTNALDLDPTAAADFARNRTWCPLSRRRRWMTRTRRRRTRRESVAITKV